MKHLVCDMSSNRLSNEDEEKSKRTKAFTSWSKQQNYTDFDLNDVDLHEYETCIDMFEEKSCDQRVVYGVPKCDVIKFSFLHFSFFMTNIWVEYGEKPSHIKFYMNRFMKARDMTADNLISSIENSVN